MKGNTEVHDAITISTNCDYIWGVLIGSPSCWNLTQPELSEEAPMAGVPMAQRTSNSGGVRNPDITTLSSLLFSALWLHSVLFIR